MPRPEQATRSTAGSTSITSSSRSRWASASTRFGGMPWLVWGGFVRSVLLLHTTWLVNSATHLWGTRRYATRDTSTNLWWVGLLAYGEGWHNNHHAFPTSARHGLRWWEFDLTYGTIRLLSWLKLAARDQTASREPSLAPRHRGRRRAPSVSVTRPFSPRLQRPGNCRASSRRV